jgi:hypothetical protein
MCYTTGGATTGLISVVQQHTALQNGELAHSQVMWKLVSKNDLEELNRERQ